MVSFIAFSLLLNWVLFTLTMVITQADIGIIQPMSKFMWNTRIMKMSNPPLSLMMKQYERKSFIMVLIWVLILNGGINLLMYVLGSTKIGLSIVFLQGVLMGNILGQADEKTKIYGVVTLIFELSAFTVSGCLGFYGRADLWWVSSILLAENAIAEACGVLVGAQGVPGVDAVREKQFK